MTRLDEIKARLAAAQAEHPYEVADRHEIASQAWSDLYQHAPSDLEYLIRQLETRSHDLRIAEATADDRLRAIERLTSRLTTRRPSPRVGDPIVLRVQKGGPEYVVRPCKGKHREMVLDGYVILSCRKCLPVRLDQDSAAADGDDQ